MESINITAYTILSKIYKNKQIKNVLNIYTYIPQNRYIFKFLIDDTYYIIKLVENKICSVRTNTVNCMKIAKNKLGNIVPEVYHDGEYENFDYLIMDYIEGVILANVWKNIEDEHKNKIKRDIYKVIRIMRSVEFNFIGSIKSIEKNIIPGPLTDHNIIEGKNMTKWNRGPFLSLGEWLISGLLLDIDDNETNEIFRCKVLKLIDHIENRKELIDNESVKFVLSHGDFDIYNIIVDSKNYTIKGIIDWEYSGSYPIYYEFIKRSISKSKIKDLFETEISNKILEIEYMKYYTNKYIKEQKIDLIFKDL